MHLVVTLIKFKILFKLQINPNIDIWKLRMNIQLLFKHPFGSLGKKFSIFNTIQYNTNNYSTSSFQMIISKTTIFMRRLKNQIHMNTYIYSSAVQKWSVEKDDFIILNL